MSDTPTVPTPLVTPAKQHDSKYPKPMPDFVNPNQPIGTGPTSPNSTTQGTPMLNAVAWDNPRDEGGAIVLPKGDFIQANFSQVAGIADIALDTTSNFHPQTGLCVISLITDSTYSAVETLFYLPNRGGGFYYTFQPATRYKFVFTLANFGNNDVKIFPLSIEAISL